MGDWDSEATMLAERVAALREPYRENTIQWLEACTQTPMHDLASDLRGFLVGLHPIVRESFLLHTRWILDEAIARFGRSAPRRAAGADSSARRWAGSGFQMIEGST